MPSIAKLGDLCTGHDGFPPRPSTSGSADVSVNGKPAVRVTDTWGTHCKKTSCHGGVVISGSTKMSVNGLAVARTGDLISCGSVIAEGSADVFSG